MRSASMLKDIDGLADAKHLPVSSLLDTGFVRDALQEQVGPDHATISSVEAEHVRYVPGVSLVASYRLRFTKSGHAQEQETRVYCKASRAEAFPRALERARGLAWSESPLFSSPVSCPGLHALLFEFPNDARLRHLKSIQPGPLGMMLSRFVDGESAAMQNLQVELLRYKPESRCVARVRFENTPDARPSVAVLRWERPDKVSGSYQQLSQLSYLLDGDPLLGVAPPLFAVETQGISAVRWVDGDPLSHRLAGADKEADLCRVGVALQRLHHLSTREVPRLAATDFLIRARQSVDHLTQHGPSADAASALLAALVQAESKFPAAPFGFTHGDFHQGQVICGAEKLWFLDFDRACLSEVDRDTGGLLAHLHLLDLKSQLRDRASCERAFLAGYRETAGYVPEAGRLNFWTALGLLELAAKQFRRLKPGWPERIAVILERGLELVQDGAAA